MKNARLKNAVEHAVAAPAEGDIVFFRVFRDVSDANDDMTEDARLIGVKILYTNNGGKDT